MRLTRAAARLNAQSGHKELPPLIFLTDDERTPDPVPAIVALPRGSLVIVRSTNANRRRELAHTAARIAQRHGLAVHQMVLERQDGGAWHFIATLTQNLNRGAISQGQIDQALELSDSLHQRGAQPAQLVGQLIGLVRLDIRRQMAAKASIERQVALMESLMAASKSALPQYALW